MKYIDKLRNSGLRPTKQRLKICEVLFDTEKTFHFTINELDQKIKKQINNKISLANIEYKPSNPLYNSKPSKMLFSI